MSKLSPMFRHLSVLQNDPTSTIELVADWFDEFGVDYTIYKLFDNEFPTDLGDALLVLGGRPSANQDDEYPFLADARMIIREAVEANIPMFGICLGMQLLTLAMGGTMDIRGPRGVESGAVKINWESEAFSDPVLSALARTYPDGAMVSADHADGILEIPPGAQVLANSDKYIHAIRLGSAIGVQFHPEAGPQRLSLWEKSRNKAPQTFVNDWWAHKADRIRVGKLLMRSFVTQDENIIQPQLDAS